MKRRAFLHSAAAGGLASIAIRTAAAEKSGRRLRTALIGCGWWGGNILGEAIASGACEVVGLCDVDRRQIAAIRERIAKVTSDQPREHRDYRELLAKEKPEIVIVATPDHWHALPVIAAVKAGAHVFVEKPIGHTIGEGRAMLNAARAAGRVVQVGTHRRTSPHTIQAREFIRSGKVGKIGMVRCFVNNAGAGPEKPSPTLPVPVGLDWDAWCGPAPLRPYSSAIHPRGFRQYLDYANGTIGDWGIHWFDQLIWITDLKWPRKIFGTGGRPIKGAPVLTASEQTSDAPDHQMVTYDFDGLTVTWESRLFAGHNVEKGENAGCHFYGTNGIFHLGWRGGWTFYPAKAGEPVLHEDAKLNAPDGQNIRELWADFLDAIRQGRPPMYTAEALHRLCTTLHLGAIAMELGRPLKWDPVKEQFDDAAANALRSRTMRDDWKKLARS